MNSSAFWSAVALLFCFSQVCRAETGGAAGGRGGPFLQFHSASLSNFDSDLSGNPIVIGGSGLGIVARSFRVGGAGGAGFVFNPSQNVQFGLGYGGFVGELIIANWLNARLLIGGGGYSAAKVTTETETTRVLDKISAGGFFLFHPSINADIPLNNMLRLNIGMGYFLPNVAKLQSITLNVGLNFARN